MKRTLRCHDFGWGCRTGIGLSDFILDSREHLRQNRASPQGVVATIAASFVARLANTASIGRTSLRAIDDSVSQRRRVSSC
jgi:hypothetical protein